MNGLIDLDSPRAQEARLYRKIGDTGYKALLVVGSVALIAAVAAAFSLDRRYAVLMLSPMLACYLPAIWWKRHLSVLPPSGNDLAGTLSVDALSRLQPGMPMHPQAMWTAIQGDWQAGFFTTHLLISSETVAQNMSTDPAELQYALQLAGDMAKKNDRPLVEVGFITAGLMLASGPMRQFLTEHKAQESDIEAIGNWIGRSVAEEKEDKGNFG
ncbi:MAG TPA: hypothetical protein VD706_02475, partial [Candidatus Saccharimonadales bacterium]|nr:hypothetical protein [Candidatus Saccharimonadales bacterium]